MATTTQHKTADELIASFDAACKARPASRPPVTRAENAEARADLDARARAGQTVQSHDSKGHFTAGVKVFSVGPAPKAPAKVQRVAVEAPRSAVRVEREDRASVSAPQAAKAA
jgi:hypothetical protein